MILGKYTMISATPCRVKGHDSLSIIQGFPLYADKLKVVNTIPNEMALAISETISYIKHQKSIDNQWQVQTGFVI